MPAKEGMELSRPWILFQRRSVIQTIRLEPLAFCSNFPSAAAAIGPQSTRKRRISAGCCTAAASMHGVELHPQM
jgi:hypothetical protein